MVLKWLPVAVNQAIDGEAPEAGDSPIKTGEGEEACRRWGASACVYVWVGGGSK